MQTNLTETAETQICMAALADLFERDIAELKQTNQPGAAGVIHKLETAVREIRRETTRTFKKLP